MKVCKECKGATRPFRRGRCNNCYQKAWNKSHYNTERSTKSIRRQRQADPRGQMVRSARNRAKNKNLPFELTKSDLTVPALLSDSWDTFKFWFQRFNTILRPNSAR